jgi:hypothetical protein
MKQAGYTKRSYSRSPERQRSSTRQSTSPSGDPKVRGNAQQCVDKYLTLARDAASSGDPISAENYYQFADHYHRILLEHRVSRYVPVEKKQEDREPVVIPSPVPQQTAHLLE